MAGIRLEKVAKSFGKVEIIHGIDLDIKEKEFVVFVGPSGCGKSTLLRMISGLETTDAGAIHIGEKDVTHLEPVDRNIAMVFQSYALYPHMTVEENMGFGLKANGMAAREVRSRVEAAAKSLQLETYMNRKPKQLSGGQRQRVAIGRAIVRKPDVFLFDEPLSNLDAELRVHMRIEIARLHKELGATMVYVTHDQVEAMTLADKIVVLQAGKIMQVGTPLQLYDDPDNLFVAGFIGSPKMNFLKSTIAEVKKGKVTLNLSDFEGPQLELDIAADHVKVGDQVQLGIRPEHFSFEQVEGAKIELNCDVTEQMGDVSYIYADIAEGSQLIVQRREDRSVNEGDKISLFIPKDKTYLFQQDGNRVR